MLNLYKKYIVLLGPTASGKTGLGVKLAKKFGAEIISADSRQVYKGMDIGTGKDLSEYTVSVKIKIAYHLIDVVSPKTEFSLAKFQQLTFKAMEDILNRGKMPMLVGGTGLYLQAVADEYNLSEVGPDKKLRQKLEKLNTEQLFKKYSILAETKAKKLNLSDRQNKRRLIRLIELEKKPMASRFALEKKYEPFIIGLNPPKDILHKRIHKRLIERLEKENMVQEVEKLHRQGVTWKRLEGFGLEYKYISYYLRDKLSYEQMVEELDRAIRQFAKRQITWFRRWERQGKVIHWVKNKKEAEDLIKTFLLK